MADPVSYKDIKGDVGQHYVSTSPFRKVPTKKKLEKMRADEGLVGLKETEELQANAARMAKRAKKEREEAIQSMVRATPALSQAEGARSTLGGITADPALRAQEKARADAQAAQLGQAGQAAQQAMFARLDEQAAKFAAQAAGAPYQPSAIGQHLATTGASMGMGLGEDVLRSNIPGLEKTVSGDANEEVV